MYLTLEIVSANGAALGSKRRMVVSEKGAQIGRGRTNDWVIDDPYISREQACIRYLNGAFYVEGLGKNPIAIADPQSTVPNHEPRILRSGERFFLDHYEIEATISNGQYAQSPVLDDPFADAHPSPSGSSSAEDSATSPMAPSEGVLPWDSPEPVLGGISDAEQDVLKGFPGAAKDEPTLAPMDLDQVSPIREQFTPPPVRSKAPPPPRTPPHSRGSPGGGASGNHDDWDQSHFAPVPQPPPVRKPVSEPPRAKSVVRDTLPPRVAPPPPEEPAPQRAFEKPQPSRTRTAEPRAPVRGIESRAPAAAASDLGSLQDLLRGAGIRDGEVSPEMAAELGNVFGIMVRGVMDALQARAEVKLQFRMQATRVQPSDNNPLKFSPNVEHALHTLLVERNPGYMSTARAFEDAFQDLRNHQMAILAGIRAAFGSMLEQFDPKRLQEKLGNDPSWRGLLGAGKGRFQELYAEHFRALTSDSDECFRRLFGEVFTEAYEKQLEVLKSAAASRRPGAIDN